MLHYLDTTSGRTLVFQLPAVAAEREFKIYVDSDWSATLSVSGKGLSRREALAKALGATAFLGAAAALARRYALSPESR